MRRPLLLFAILLLASCTDEYICKSDEYCDFTGLAGRCLDDKMGHRYCAEPFDGCPTRYRWGLWASPALRYRCVRPEYFPPDGGADGDAAPPPADASSDTDGPRSS